MDRTVVVPGDDRLSLGRIKKLEIGLGDFARSLGVDIAVDEGDRRLGEDRQRGRDDLELVLAEFAEREVSFVLPGDQHVAEAALGEGNRRAAGAGVEHGRVPVDRGDEIAGLVLVAVERLEAVSPGGQEIPARAPRSLRVRGDDGDAGPGEIVPVVDPLGVALADQEDDRGRIGRGIVRQALLPVGRDLSGLGGDRVDVGGERQSHHVRLETVDHRAGLRARSAMRLLDRDRLAGGLLPLLDEGRVHRPIELAGRIVRDIEQRRFGARGRRSGNGEGRKREGQRRGCCDPKGFEHERLRFIDNVYRFYIQKVNQQAPRQSQDRLIVARDRSVVRRHAVRKIEHRLVDIAPAPALRRIIALDDRMARGLEMPGRVLVRGLVAASDVAACAADAANAPMRRRS